jgi:hypothetical protein
MSIYAIVGRFLFGLLASALGASIGSKGCPFGLVGYLVTPQVKQVIRTGKCGG